jgi:hypothetical protein
MGYKFEELIDELSDNIRAEEGDPIKDTIENYLLLLDVALMNLEYEIHVYNGIIEKGCKPNDPDLIIDILNGRSSHELFLKWLCEHMGKEKFLVYVEQTLKKIFLRGYEAPNKNIEVASELGITRLCFSHFAKLIQRGRNIDQRIVTRLSLSAAKLLYACGHFGGVGTSLASKKVRVDKSTETRGKKADEAYNKVVEVYIELSQKVPRWEKKSNSQKAERIEEELNIKMGIKKGKKPYRATNTIEKRDLPRAKSEDLI